ncbi:doublecortin domain-containing protein 1-like [Clupea harengus]|uniref:Doublecortin domain-containing protein 1-like n=1 Tax=Clupea harengus TaxID=7950 RepID=A0A8M1KH34_CLUHA|nr:doublecortin domain-containing protein 1-like [Clupea harengus]
MSCGEPFRPPDVVKLIERQRAARWMKKGKLCVDLEIRRHKLRQQKARLPPSQDSSSLISQTIRRASETTAELNSSETHISVEESVLERECREDLLKEGSISATHNLYHQPKVKRVLVHCNGGDITQSVYVWGRTIDEVTPCICLQEMWNPQ